MSLSFGILNTHNVLLRIDQETVLIGLFRRTHNILCETHLIRVVFLANYSELHRNWFLTAAHVRQAIAEYVLF